MKTIIFLLLVCISLPAAAADMEGINGFLLKLAEEQKLPDNPFWIQTFAEGLQSAGAEMDKINPLVFLLMAESFPELSGEGDAAATAGFVAALLKRGDEDIRRGTPPQKFRQEARRELGGLDSLQGGDSAALRIKNRRQTAAAIMENLENRGRANRPFDVPPGKGSYGSGPTHTNSPPGGVIPESGVPGGESQGNQPFRNR